MKIGTPFIYFLWDGRYRCFFSRNFIFLDPQIFKFLFVWIFEFFFVFGFEAFYGFIESGRGVGGGWSPKRNFSESTKYSKRCE